MNSHLAQVFVEFQSRMGTFAKVKYDLLDLSESLFEKDFIEGQVAIQDLERRIGTIICQAFDDCPGLYSCFRMIECFSGLLNRTIIKNDFESKNAIMIEMFSKEISDINSIFNKYKEDPPIHQNMAPVTGALSWAKELKDRISTNMERFNSVLIPLLPAILFFSCQIRFLKAMLVKKSLKNIILFLKNSITLFNLTLMHGQSQ